MSTIAHRVLSSLCCCEWLDEPWMRVHEHPDCPVHGRDFARRERQRLIKERECACVAIREHMLEARAWIARYKRSKTRLAELNAKLKELGE
jgi:hypothetical protein